ncbi:MAG: TolC family protein [Bacteroidaceae bacterium]|nr:TolC family protein [Bacteroidaceae bacterium]
MKETKLFLIIGLFFVGIPSFSQQIDLTLQKAIEIALAENPTIRVADKEIQLKENAKTEAWMALLPEVTANASLQHTLIAAEMKLSGNSFKMGRDGVNTGNVSAALNVPVFAPAVYQAMKLSKQDILLAQEKARGSRLDLINQVTKAYYHVLLAQDSYDVVQKAYNTSKQSYDVVEQKFNVGKVSEYDKISAEVQMRSMNSSLVSTKNALSLVKLQLKVLMGINPDLEVNIVDKLENYQNEMLLSEVTAVADELQNNSTLKQLDLNKSMLERNLKIQRTNFMPTVAFSLTGQYQSLYNDNWKVWDYEWSPSASFTFAVSIPIFKASNWTKLKSTKIQLSQLSDSRLNAERSLLMSVQSYRNNMASSIAQMESNKTAVEQADKAVTISAKRYEVGRGTILELNQSQVALTQAQLTYVQSIYEYLTNKSDLNYTLGREF